mgnify:CR=1 FL=1
MFKTNNNVFIDNTFEYINIDDDSKILIFQSFFEIKEINLEQSINNEKNGEKYNSILLDMYPIIKKFLEKYKDSHYTLMTRLTE